MADQAVVTLNVSEAVKSRWGWFLGLGILFVLGGLFALLSPLVASLVVTGIIAGVLVVIGLVQIFQAWGIRSWAGFLWQLLIGVAMLAGGIVIYINPLAGTLALTILVGASFLAKGIFQIMLGLQVRPNDAWGWLVSAGVVDLLVGVMIFLDFPVSGAYALGILAGISLIFTGWSYIALALAARRLATA